MELLAQALEQYFPGVWSPPDRKSTGLLFALCGFDGSGKTTQVRILADKLTSLGKEVVVTRQPTNWYRSQPAVHSFLGEGGEEDALHLALLAAADRRAHIIQTVIPALRRGAVVISDRYLYSTFCYFLGRGLSVKRIAELNRCIPRPTVAFYLDLPPETLIKRIIERDGRLLKREERSIDTVSAVVSTFRLLCEGDHSLMYVDGSRDIRQVHGDIWRSCSRYI